MKKNKRKMFLVVGLVFLALVLTLSSVAVAIYVNKARAEKEKNVVDYNKQAQQLTTELDRENGEFNTLSADLAAIFIVPETLSEDGNQQLATVFNPEKFEISLLVHEKNIEPLKESISEAEKLEHVDYDETAETYKELTESLKEAKTAVAKYEAIFEYYKLAFPLHRAYIEESADYPRMSEFIEEEQYRVTVDNKVYKFEQIKNSAVGIQVQGQLEEENQNFIKLIENRQTFIKNRAEELINMNRELVPIYESYRPFNTAARSNQYQQATAGIRERHAEAATASKTLVEADRQAYIAIIQNRNLMFTEQVSE